jgi:hypothetical protein
MTQPREHPVQCSRCGRLTWNATAICDRHLDRLRRLVEARKAEGAQAFLPNLRG